MWFLIRNKIVVKRMESFNIKIIRHLMSNTSYFIVCEATCFGPYVIIIRPYESSQ